MYLISLLNAIFANKKIPRIIKSLAIENPYLEKRSKDDKLSILDLRAQLDDGSTALVEMHLYDIDDLKYKTIRSWARAYGEKIKSGERYTSQPPVICVAFVNGSVEAGDTQKIHKCCKIMDIDDHTFFTDALELHYIDMKAFVKAINESGGIGNGETEDTMLAKWLAVITEKDIADKSIITNICEQEEEIAMAVSTLVRLSEDKVTRQEYLKWQDELMIQLRKERRLTELEVALAEKDSALAEKDSALAVKDAENERLRQELAKLRVKHGEQ